MAVEKLFALIDAFVILLRARIILKTPTLCTLSLVSNGTSQSWWANELFILNEFKMLNGDSLTLLDQRTLK